MKKIKSAAYPTRECFIFLGGGGNDGLATGGRDVVPTAHGLIKDRDRNLVVVVIVEDEEVLGHDLVLLAEPPPPTGQVRCAGAVEEELRGP
jgi:hypothetical protein